MEGHELRRLKTQATRIGQKMIAEGKVCEKCGSNLKLQIHHKKPLKDGGTNDSSNLMLLCFDCHKGLYGVHGKYGKLGIEETIEIVGIPVTLGVIK